MDGFGLATAPGLDQMEFVETMVPIGSVQAITSALVYLGRVRVGKPVPVTQMSYGVGTASGNVNLGIYTYNPATATYTLVAWTASTAAAGASVIQTIPLVAAYTMLPGVDYALAFQADNGTITAQRTSALNTFALNNRATTKAITYNLATNGTSLASVAAATTLLWIAAS